MEIQNVCEFPLDVHVLRWEIVWRNAPRIWRDFGSALPFQTRLTQIKSVLPLSNEHGSQVKDQVRRKCCYNKHKKFPYRPTRDVSLLSGHVSYVQLLASIYGFCCTNFKWDHLCGSPQLTLEISLTVNVIYLVGNTRRWPLWRFLDSILTLWRRNFLLNFSTPCI